MGIEDFVSESEAVSMSGVSKTTLGRFVEAGYLKPESDADGLRLFSRRELHLLFGAPLPAPPAATGGTMAGGTMAGENSRSLPSHGTDASPSTPVNYGLNDDDRSSFISEASPPLTNGTATDTAPSAVPPASERADQTSASTRELRAESTPLSGEMQSPPGDLGQIPSAAAARSIFVEHLEREAQRLKHIINLQENLLSLKDDEVKQLRDERDWLRQRLERAEAKAERDQLLLLSETQTVRRLVSLHENRKSLLATALDWLGLGSTPSRTLPLRPKTIETARAASGDVTFRDSETSRAASAHREPETGAFETPHGKDMAHLKSEFKKAANQ